MFYYREEFIMLILPLDANVEPFLAFLITSLFTACMLVCVLFFTGDYAGYDEKQPTSRSGGKPNVISLLKEKHGYKK